MLREAVTEDNERTFAHRHGMHCNAIDLNAVVSKPVGDHADARRQL